MIRLGEVQCTHVKLELIATCLVIISVLFPTHCCTFHNFIFFFKIIVTFYVK
jgi:hypothetical protein